MWREVLGCLENFCVLAMETGSAMAATRLAATVTLTGKRLELVRRPAAEARWQGCLDRLRQVLGDGGFVAAWNEAWERWETEDAIKAALSLPTEAGTAVLQ
jgi:hypothetical protein